MNSRSAAVRSALRPGARDLVLQDWAWLVAELKTALDDALACLGLVLAVQRWERQRVALAGRPPVDLDAERAVLAASIVANGLEPWVGIEDFGEPLHRTLAALLVTGEGADDLAHPEVVGYLRGLLRDHDGGADVLPAVLRVAALARQRRALRLVEQAAGDLRQPDCDHGQVLGVLRRAVEHLEGG